MTGVSDAINNLVELTGATPHLCSLALSSNEDDINAAALWLLSLESKEHTPTSVPNEATATTPSSSPASAAHPKPPRRARPIEEIPGSTIIHGHGKEPKRGGGGRSAAGGAAGGRMCDACGKCFQVHDVGSFRSHLARCTPSKPASPQSGAPSPRGGGDGDEGCAAPPPAAAAPTEEKAMMAAAAPQPPPAPQVPPVPAESESEPLPGFVPPPARDSTILDGLAAQAALETLLRAESAAALRHALLAACQPSLITTPLIATALPAAWERLAALEQKEAEEAERADRRADRRAARRAARRRGGGGGGPGHRCAGRRRCGAFARR